MAVYGPISYEMGADPFRNAVAAMPSVHIVYAAIAGVGLAILAKPWWMRTLAILYIPLSIFVIVLPKSLSGGRRRRRPAADGRRSSRMLIQRAFPRAGPIRSE